MKRLMTCAALCTALYGFGQYNTAVGVRVGETSGLTIKGFVADDAAIEGILGLWHRGVSLTAMYELHNPAFNANGLSWYFGAGGHVALSNRRDNYDWYRFGQRRYYIENGEAGLGIDGIIGLEYKIPQAPIAFSLDLKPFIEFGTRGGGWVSLDPGLGIKAAF
jgi:hypothetical protein